MLIYDGDCGFCQACVSWARRRIHPGLQAQPYQQADLGGLGLSAERAAREVLWAAADGRVSGGAQAVAALLADAGGAWRVAGLALRLPPLSWLARGGYRLVAANRRRLPGGTPYCGPGS